MAFKEVSAFSDAIDIKDEVNKQIVGHYTGSRKIQTKIGEQVIWEFKGDEKETIGVFGFTNLNSAMKQIKPGDYVRLTYLGTKNLDTKFGKKDVHQVSVEKDDDKQEVPF